MNAKYRKQKFGDPVFFNKLWITTLIPVAGQGDGVGGVGGWLNPQADVRGGGWADPQVDVGT